MLSPELVEGVQPESSSYLLSLAESSEGAK